MRETVAFAHINKKTGDHSGIVLHRPAHLVTKMEPATVKYDGAADKDKLSDWINNNYHGLVGHRTGDNARDFKMPLVVAYYDVDYVKNVKGTNYWRNRVMKIAKGNTDVNFAVSNKEDFLSELNEYGMDTPSTPDQKAPLVAARDAQGQKFVMTEEFSVDNLDKFVKDFTAGKLEAYMKSEPVPDNSANAVKVAVAKNFQELVMMKKKRTSSSNFMLPGVDIVKN